MSDEQATSGRVGDWSGGGGASLASATYRAAIGSQQADLPIVAVDGERAIALMMTIDLGVGLMVVAAAELARLLAPARPELIVSVATLGIPVAFEVSRCLGLDDYLILQKPKGSLARLPARAGPLDHVHRHPAPVAGSPPDRLRSRPPGGLVDDVISTGASAVAALRLLRRAGADLVAVGALLAESDAWRSALGDDADLVQTLGRIPLFRPGPQGGWIPDRD